jgi:phytoene dehydrogenase-like protein
MEMSTTHAYDVIVIGAGHNGLTAASLLSKQGRKVLVLERRNVIGGMAAGEEFHPGFRTSGLLHDTSQVRPYVINALDLKTHGLKIIPQRPSILALDHEGRGLLLGENDKHTANEIRSVSDSDADQYLAYRAFIAKVKKPIVRILDNLPPVMDAADTSTTWNLFKTAIAVRRLGKKDMMALMRIIPMCVADWLNEWFETDCLKAALAATAMTGNFAGPWSPGTAVNMLLWECVAQHHIKGGPQALISTLEKAAKTNGAELRTESEVKQVKVSAGSVTGVVLDSGERIQAPVVAASCDPRHTLLDLVSSDHIDTWMIQRIQHIRGTGTTAKLNLALNTPLEFAGRPAEPVEFARTGSHFDQIEKAFDAAKYGRYAATPILDIHVPTVSNPNLAPQGHSVVSILIHFVPYKLRNGWNHQQAETLKDVVVSALEQYAPGVSRAIVARQLLSPVDLEARYALVKGHIHHGEHALDQLILRPTPECAGYQTPIKGLYLCGSGSHPGGGITCGPGALAASVIAHIR